MLNTTLRGIGKNIGKARKEFSLDFDSSNCIMGEMGRSLIKVRDSYDQNWGFPRYRVQRKMKL